MKIYLFNVHGSDFGGWVVADTIENAKKAISELYGDDVRQTAILTETAVKAMAIGSYPWEHGLSIATVE